MPPLPVVPKVLRVAVSGQTTSSTVWLTRFFIQYTGTAPTNAQLHTFDAALISAYTSDLAALVDVDTSLRQIETIDLSSVTGAVDTSPTSVGGSRTGDPLPEQVAVVQSYEIGRRYRGGHPRGYWRAGVIADIAAGKQWTGAFVSAFQTGVDAFFTAALAAGWSGAGTLTHVNVSYYSGFTVITNPITHRARNVPTLRVAPLIDQVTSTITRTSLGTQRRREDFIG
jgi:hypothetical protein